jgi:acetyl-CoA synthetase
MNKNWHPSKSIIENSNIFKMMQKLGMNSYKDFWKWSVENKASFWEATIANLGIQFDEKYSSIINVDEGIENAKWIFESKLNIIDSCFQNEDNSIAIVFQEENGSLQKITQKNLEIKVNQVANGLTDLGIEKGAVIAIDMPMTLEAVVVYLAAIKAGIIAATIADSFSSNEIAVRLEITNPSLIITQDVLHRNGKTHPLYEKIKNVSSLKTVVVSTISSPLKLKGEDVFWDVFLSNIKTFVSVKQSPEEAITILFSSGTTGEPKAIPWNHTTPIKAASDAYYHHDIKKNDIVCWPTNLGWMMGPWLVFSALLNKATIGLYYGSPLQNEFGKFVEQAKVTMLGVVPSIVKSWKSSRDMESYDWNAIRCFSSTGEVSNPEEMNYLMQLAKHKPVIEYCGGTEIGGGYIASTLVQENVASQFSSQTLGGEFVLLDEDGNESLEGEVFLIPPIMGLSTRLFNKNHHKTYYAGIPNFQGKTLRRHGDQFTTSEKGYYKARGRVDDAMNLGGIKVSAIQIEDLVNTLEFVDESAAISVSPKNGGPSSLVVFYVPIKNKERLEALNKIQNLIKTRLNPLFKVVDLVKIDILPRTASNKIIRKELRSNYASS